MPPFSFSHAISTISGRLLSTLTTSPLKSLAKTPAVTVMVVNLYYSDPNILPERGFGYLIPRSIPFEQNPECALGVVFDSDSSIGLPPPAGVLIVPGAMTKGFQAYRPDTLTISLAIGGKVVWRNDDAITHTVTDTTAAAAFSRTLGAGDTASVVFSATGEFPFKCSIHPTMRGLIVVTS